MLGGLLECLVPDWFWVGKRDWKEDFTKPGEATTIDSRPHKFMYRSNTGRDPSKLLRSNSKCQEAANLLSNLQYSLTVQHIYYIYDFILSQHDKPGPSNNMFSPEIAAPHRTDEAVNPGQLSGDSFQMWNASCSIAPPAAMPSELWLGYPKK